MANETRIDLCDQKYTVVIDLPAGKFEALRYGESWRNLSGDKLVLGLCDEITRLKAEVQQLQAALSAEKAACVCAAGEAE